jgi:hypothetical protein
VVSLTPVSEEDFQQTLDAIRNFRDQFRGRGPEIVPISP